MFIKAKVSFEKVEKVVKPPQNPTTSKRRMLLLGSKLIKRPIKKQPIMFTKNVDKGNEVASPLDKSTEVRKRKTLPAAPPSATNSICFII